MISRADTLTVSRTTSLARAWYVDLPTVDLWVEEHDGEPDAPTVLLVHGWGSDSRVWDRLVAAGRGTRFIAVDLRGHGRSTMARTKHTVDAMAADLHLIARRLRLREAVVVGHSMGANVAVELGVRAPRWLRAVAVVDPAYDDTGWADASNRVCELRRRGSVAAAELLTHAFGPAVDPAIPADVAARLVRTDPDVLIQSLGSTYLDERAFGHRPQTRAKLAQLTLPLLSVYARSEVAAAAADLPVADATVTTIADTGHYIPLERPAELWAAISRWLTDLNLQQEPAHCPAAIDDVARLAGVSASTVSRVMTGAAPVLPATRARVLAAIAELDYHPSEAARALAGRRRQGRVIEK